MPRKAKGARLYWRERKGRDGVWVILDTGMPERSTGTSDRGEADLALAAYLSEKRGRPTGPAAGDELTVAQALTMYGEDHAPTVADPARIGYAIMALDKWWKDSKVSAITKATCRRYAAERDASAGTVRKELGTLRAALNWCVEEGFLLVAPFVWLPEKPEPKQRWLTRSEAAQLLRAARKYPRSRHLCRFILVGLYTGTRKEAILSLRFEPHPTGGWIDVEHGLLYRRGEGERVTKKRRAPARLPQKLLGHAKRWERDGGWVVNFEGSKVGSIKTSWNRIKRDAGLPDVTPHTLKHTAITWAMQSGVKLADAAGFFSTSVEVLEANYLHHHPDFQAETAAAMDRRA